MNFFKDLRVAQDQLRLVFESAPNALIMSDRHGRITLVNAQAEAMFGYRSEELLHRPLEILFPPRFRDRLAQLRGAAAYSAARDWFGLRKDGSEFPAETILTPLQTEDGVFALSAISDLTEREQSARAMALLASIVESSEDSIIGSDLDGVILSWNRGAEKLFGYAPEEVIGKRITILFPPGRESEQLRNLEAIRHQQRIERFESQRVRKDGTQIEVAATLSPIKNALGRLEGASVIYRDITKQKETETELLNAKKAAETASQAKSEFLANMSHEIRTPMNVLLGMSSLLLDTDLTEEQRDYAQTIRRGADSLLTVINDILDFSKIEARKLEIEVIDFALEEVVGEVTDLMSEQASAKGLDLNAELDPKIPAMLRGDPGRLRQVLVNLVGNAIKFTKQGEINLSVRQEPDEQDRIDLRFEVRDTGIGIAPAVQARIFEAFTQADGSTTRNYGGTGLGLSISMRLVDLMGGKIGLRSEAGRGSTFWFTIPLIPGTAGAQPDSWDFTGLEELKVLAVDDSETNRRIVQEQLRSLNIGCAIAENAMQAIIQVRDAAAQGHPFHLVILDYGMPGMNGIDLARIIRSDTTLICTRLILMTSYAEKKHREMAVEAGIDVVLNKPVRTSELRRALARAQRRTTSTSHQTPPAPPVVAAPCGRLLMVEDNSDNCKLAVQMLRKYGYECDLAVNGEEAVRALSEKQYPLILMDCQMPVMDGFQATAAIRRMEGSGRHTPIIAMTAHSMQGDRERCLDAGMDDYISKPLIAEKLVAVVQHWAGQLPAATGEAVRVRISPEVESLIPAYLSNRRNDLLALSNALESHDVGVVGAIGHDMKGSGAGYGFSRITEIGRDLEQAAREANLSEIQDLVRTLADYLERLEVASE